MPSFVSGDFFSQKYDFHRPYLEKRCLYSKINKSTGINPRGQPASTVYVNFKSKDVIFLEYYN